MALINTLFSLGGNLVMAVASPRSSSISISSAITSIFGLAVRLALGSRISPLSLSPSRRSFLVIFFAFLVGAGLTMEIFSGAFSSGIFVKTARLSFLIKSSRFTSLSFVLSNIVVCISTFSSFSGSVILTMICSIFLGIGFTFNFSKTLVDIYYIK